VVVNYLNFKKGEIDMMQSAFTKEEFEQNVAFQEQKGEEALYKLKRENMGNKPLIINLFGSPCSGKSTIAALLFYKLKADGYKCELVTEYAKDKTYENNVMALSDQIYVFAKQNYRINRIVKDGEVDVIITDSPLLLSTYYNSDETTKKELDNLVKTVVGSHRNMNIFLKRFGEYQQYGRTQTKEESEKMSDEMYSMFGDEMHYVFSKFDVIDDPQFKFVKLIEDMIDGLMPKYI